MEYLFLMIEPQPTSRPPDIPLILIPLCGMRFPHNTLLTALGRAYAQVCYFHNSDGAVLRRRVLVFCHNPHVPSLLPTIQAGIPVTGNVEIEWSKTLSIPNSEVGTALFETTEGGFAAVSVTCPLNIVPV